MESSSALRESLVRIKQERLKQVVTFLTGPAHEKDEEHHL